MSEEKARYVVTKHCPRCGRTLPLTPEYWYRNRTKWDGFASHCKECGSAYEKTPERHAYRRAYAQTPKRKTSMRANHRRRKQTVIDAYGGRCVDCGETNLDVLETDHSNNDGAEFRRTQKEKGKAAANTHYLYSVYYQTGIWPEGIAVRCEPCHDRVGRDRRKSTSLPVR